MSGHPGTLQGATATETLPEHTGGGSSHAFAFGLRCILSKSRSLGVISSVPQGENLDGDLSQQLPAAWNAGILFKCGCL